MSYSDRLDVLHSCIKHNIPENEAKNVIDGIQKLKENKPGVCIDIEKTISENTGYMYTPEGVIISLCDGNHVHYIPKIDKLFKKSTISLKTEEVPLQV